MCVLYLCFMWVTAPPICTIPSLDAAVSLPTKTDILLLASQVIQFYYLHLKVTISDFFGPLWAVETNCLPMITLTGIANIFTHPAVLGHAFCIFWAVSPAAEQFLQCCISVGPIFNCVCVTMLCYVLVRFRQHKLLVRLRKGSCFVPGSAATVLEIVLRSA